MSQQFCLKWNNHMNNMMDVFKSLLSTESMVDVTLACDGLSLKAHKIVLSACSPFFQSLFLENPCKHPIVILKDMKYSELKAIIEFMYHGEVNVAQDQLSALMKTAETLRVKGLAEVTNEKNSQSSNASQDEPSHRSSTRNETPPPSKRRRGRVRKRSLSDSNRSDDSNEPKIKQPVSPDIEELSGDHTMDASSGQFSNLQSQVPMQSTPSHTNSFHKSSVVSQDPQIEEPASADESEFGVEPAKLLEQTLTTDDLSNARRSGRSSLPSGMEMQRRPRSSTDHSSNLVPTSMPSEALGSNQQPESPPDIKPELLELDPPMSPVAGPSHSTDNSMMMYMDQSSVSSHPGSSYQDNSTALVPQDSQPQERYTCEKCEHILTSKEALARHRLRHRSDSNEKRHRCTLCTYATNYSSHLKQHMFTHSGERPFKCTECNSAFTQNWHLRKHMLGHAAKLMLKCDRCSESFSDAKLLQKHAKLHKREDKPFRCSFCTKRFPRSSSLRRHEKKHLEDKRPLSIDKPSSKTKSSTNGDLGQLPMEWSPIVQDKTSSTLVGKCSPNTPTKKSSHPSKDLLLSGMDRRKSSSPRDKDDHLSTPDKNKPDVSVCIQRSSSREKSNIQSMDKSSRVRIPSGHRELSDKDGHSSTSDRDKQDVSIYKERSCSSDRSKPQDGDNELKDRATSGYREKSSDKESHLSTMGNDKPNVSIIKERSSSSDRSKPQDRDNERKDRATSSHREKSSDKESHSSPSDKDKQDVPVYKERSSSSENSKPQDRDKYRKDRATSSYREKSSHKESYSSTSEIDKPDVSVYKEESFSSENSKPQDRDKEKKDRATSGHREKSSDKESHLSTLEKDKLDISVYKERSSSNEKSKPLDRGKRIRDRIPRGHRGSSDKESNSSMPEKDKLDFSVYKERSSSSDKSKPRDRDKERKNKVTIGPREKSSDKDRRSDSHKEKSSREQREKTQTKFPEAQKPSSPQKGNFLRGDDKEETPPHTPKSPPPSEENKAIGKTGPGKRRSPTTDFKPPLNLVLKN